MVTSTVKVIMPGKGSVSLRATDHVATGGEGAVYLKNGLVFKIFLDPQKAQANGMPDKIALLAQLRHPFIVSPQDILLNDKHEVVGYYMEQAPGLPLMKTFTNAWRDLNAFATAQSIELAENMRLAVKAAHDFGAVMVDGNETNYLAHGVQPRVLDVDSWQVGNHKATALMPSVRDFHTNQFDSNSDWFAWGVVSFQVFTGIHPYKGTHPDFKKGDLESRMRANASVFDSKVRLNSAVRDFSEVPRPLLDWYERVFSNGERSSPPSALQSQASARATKKMHIAAGSSDTVRHDRIRGFPGAVRHVASNGVAYYWEGTSIRAFDLQRQQEIPGLIPADIERLFANAAVLVRQGEGFLFVESDGATIFGRHIPGERDPRAVQPAATNKLPLATDSLLVMGNRIFALNKQSDNGLIELEVTDMGSKLLLAVKTAWPVSVQSARFLDGCVALDYLGMPFIAVPESNELLVQRAPELIGYKVINGFGRSGSRIWVNGINRLDGQIYRLEFKSNGQEFKLLKSQVVDVALTNVTINAKGIAVSIFEDGVVTVQALATSAEKLVNDASITVDMKLFSLPDGVYYASGQDLYKLALS